MPSTPRSRLRPSTLPAAAHGLRAAPAEGWPGSGLAAEGVLPLAAGSAPRPPYAFDDVLDHGLARNRSEWLSGKPRGGLSRRNHS